MHKFYEIKNWDYANISVDWETTSCLKIDYNQALDTNKYILYFVDEVWKALDFIKVENAYNEYWEWAEEYIRILEEWKNKVNRVLGKV
jgi:hypothetical protein